MRTGDGILAALKIAEILSNSNIKTSKLFDLYKTYIQIKENIKLQKNISKQKSEQIKKIYLRYNKEYKKLRFLIRKSGTEPLLRILIEGEDKNFVNEISIKLIKELKKLINE